VRVLGIDPSSYSIGFVLLEQEELRHHEQYLTGVVDPKDADDLASALSRAAYKVISIIDDWKPDAVVIEQIGVEQNVNTVRKIAYFEGVAIAVVGAYEMPLFRPYASTSRTRVTKHIMGTSAGIRSKDDTAKLIREHLGKTEMHLPTPRSRVEVPVFTDDETDAYVLARYWWHKD